jgi:fatty-acyl-CoA synthase
MTDELHPATLWEAMADALPHADALVQGPLHRSWASFDDRAARLATALEDVGIRPSTRVGQLLFNGPEFLETYHAALKVRAVPFNINYRYTADELRYLLADADADALVYDGAVAATVAEAVADVPVRLLVEVGDGEGRVPGAVAYEDLVAGHDPAPRRTRSADDMTMVYTGGTTGRPKGVITRAGPGLAFLLEVAPGLAGEAPVAGIAGAVALAERRAAEGLALRSLPAAPLMHNTGMALGAHPALALGGAVVFTEGRSFDPAELWATVEREDVMALTIVGDAFARPLLAALDDGPARDLSRLKFMTSAGAMFSAPVKAGLVGHLPGLTIIDVIGASEGVMGLSVATGGTVPETGRFTPLPGVVVLAGDGRVLGPGTGEPGLVALPGGADRYHNDDEQSAATFRVIGDRRYTVPGDLATVEADGTLRLLGRGSACINTAGEKVFPEEVEEALKTVTGVADALVFGVHDERFGQRVVAVLERDPGADLDVDVDAVLAEVRTGLAAYKLPRAVHVVDRVPRNDAGKPDYATARALFEAALTARTT